MGTSGAAAGVTQGLVGLAGDEPLLILAILCGVTMLFSNVMNANAAAVLMFPIAIATAARLGSNLGTEISALPFAFAIMIGAASSYATPIGYQTNLMVMGPGGYHFVDYVKVGLPLSILVWGTAVLVIPRVWPF
jgi:di/tricarboxylate transporter